MIKSKGSIKKNPSNSDFTANFEFDVPAMKQKWTLEVVREQTPTKKSFSFSANNPDTKQHIKFVLDLA
jgi:hypothetical protein